MNKFWGRRENEIPSCKFSRDDEQLLALNYENLCDADYVNKLFQIQSADVLSPEVSTETVLNSNSSVNPIDDLVSSADLSEDIILFGNEPDFGVYCQEKRIIRDINSMLLQPFDSYTTLLYRQVAVFDYIGEVVINRCKKIDISPESTPILNLDNGENSDDSEDQEEDKTQEIGIGKQALLCSMKIVEKQSRLKVKKSAVQSMLGFILNIFHSSKYSQGLVVTDFADNSNSFVYLRYIRTILCNGVTHALHSLGSARHLKSSAADVQESLQLALTCAYGLLVIGFYTQGTGDIIVAITNLIGINIQVNDFKEYASEFALEDAATNPVEIVSSTLTAVNPVAPPPALNPSISNHGKPSKLKSKPIEPSIPSKSAKTSPSSLILLPGEFDHLSLSRDLNQVDLAVKYNNGKNWDKNSTVNNNSKFLGDKEKSKTISVLKGGKSSQDPSAIVIDPEVVMGNMTVMCVLTPSQRGSKSINIGTLNNNGAVSTSNQNQPGSGSGSGFHTAVPGPTSGGAMNNTSNNNSMKSQKLNLRIVKDNSTSQSQTSAKPDSPPINPVAPIPSTSLVSSRLGHNKEKFEEILNSNSKVPKNILKMISDSKFVDSVYRLTSEASCLSSTLSSKAAVNTEGSVKSYVWSCGQNSYGELGHGDVILRKSFTRISCMDSRNIIGLGAGNEHTVFLTKCGKLYVSGYNDNGQCGSGTTQQVKTPIVLQGILENEDIAQVHAYNGCEHTVALTRDGKIFSFGYNYRGQLGIGSTNSECVPRPVKSLLSRKVVNASCSYHHSYFLCSDGAIFSCGRNDCGQLGHGDCVDKKTPQHVQSSPKNITSISCGQFHTMCLADDGSVFGCGKNDYGQLGWESIDNVKVLTKFITGIPSDPENIIQVCCGYYHTMLLSGTGVVSGFGRNDYGQLGLGHVTPKVLISTTINSLRDKNATLISAGCYHTIIITANGMLYVFGRNNHGQLGTGDIEERHSPHPVDDFVGKQILRVAAGFYHTVVLVGQDNQNTQLSQSFLPRHSSLKSSVPTSHENSNSSQQESTASNPVYDHLKILNDSHNRKQKNESQSNEQQHSQKSSKKPFSIESKTKTSVHDLIVFLVEHLENFVNIPPSVTPGTADKTTAILCDPEASALDNKWLLRILKSLAVLMELSRGIMSDSLGIDAPFTSEEACKLLRTLISTAEKIFLQNHNIFQNLKLTSSRSKNTESIKNSLFSDVSQDSAGSFPIAELLSKPQIRIFNAVDVTKEILEGFVVMDSNSAVLNTEFILKQDSVQKIIVEENDDTQNLDYLLWNALGRLRQELFIIYFHLPSSDHSDPRSCTETIDCAGETIKRCYEVLFPMPVDCSELFRLLGGYLTNSLLTRTSEEFNDSIGSFEVETDRVDYSRCLKLFCRLCFNFRGINDVIKVFQSSSFHSLAIFQQILSVYNHFSMLIIESKPLNITHGVGVNELTRSMSILEHCNTNFIKVAIPIMLAVDNSSSNIGEEENSFFDLSVQIFSDVLFGAVQVIDYLQRSSSTLSDDITVQLRNTTVLPAILPTVLINGIAKSKNFNCLSELIPQLQHLVRKLQVFGRSEVLDNNSPFKSSLTALSNNRSKTFNHEAGAFNSHSDSLPFFGTLNSTALTNQTSIGIRGTSSNGPSMFQNGNASPVRKELIITSANTVAVGTSGNNQFSLWTRLLKMSTILISKLASLLIENEPSSSKATAIHEFHEHRIWRYVSLPSNLIANSKLDIPDNANDKLLLSPEIKNLISRLRTETFQKDAMYRTLVISSKVSSANRFIENMEDIMFIYTCSCCPADIVAIVSNSIIPSQILRAWAEIVVFIKSIHSKRSNILSNVSAEITISWIDILKKICKVVQAAQNLLINCPHRITQNSCLPLPRKYSTVSTSFNKPKQLWRKALLVTLCLVRWRASLRHRMSYSSQTGVKFLIDTVGFVTSNFTDMMDDINLKNKWQLLLDNFIAGNTKVIKFNTGISLFESVIRECVYLSMKVDSISILISSFLKKIPIYSQSKTQTILSSCLKFCTSFEHFAKTRRLIRSLMVSMSDIILEFIHVYNVSNMSSAGATELNLISLVVTFVHEIYICDVNMDFIHDFQVTFSHFHKLFFLLDEKSYADMHEVLTLTNSPQSLPSFHGVIIDSTGSSKAALSTTGTSLPIPQNPPSPPSSHSHFMTSSYISGLYGSLWNGILDSSNKGSGKHGHDKGESGVDVPNKDKPVAPSIISSNPKKSSLRDRNKALRKASNAVLTIIQYLSVRSAKANENKSNNDSKFFISSGANNPVIFADANLALCNYLQSARLMNIKNNAGENVDTASTAIPANNSSKDSSSSLSLGAGNSATSLLATAAAAVMSGVSNSTLIKGPLAKDASSSTAAGPNKRRCQDVINKPLEFHRNQEGFVVQGDKLISNYKGVDFTLATWIYISKRNPSNTISFITGKVSHNDAWPIVILRADSKLEIIYGHSNEFEKFSSQVAISIGVWTHVAVVIEQKRIKLFINGVMDAQVISNKGNGRAVLYPLLVGSCPQGVRTRVEFVRKGFDGMLANYKYYTRALSPIHLKVIFDQGPPELYDIREKWIYRLLAVVDLQTSSNILHKFNTTILPSSLTFFSRAADTSMLIFITETGSRLRCAAIQLLKNILLLDVVTDTNLSSNTGFNQAKFKNSIPLSKCVFLSEFSTFHERLVLYFIRILGACWSPHLSVLFGQEESFKPSPVGGAVVISSASDNELEYSRFTEFLVYAPTVIMGVNGSSSDMGSLGNGNGPHDLASRNHNININTGVTDGSTSNSVNAKVCNPILAREAAICELCSHIIQLLNNLMEIPRWQDALSSVFCRILSKVRLITESKTDWTCLSRIDILGASMFLGGKSLGVPYLGSTVINCFSDFPCRVLNVNKSTKSLTLLAKNPSNNMSKHTLYIVRAKDVSCSSDRSSFVKRSKSGFLESVISEALHLLNTYKDYIRVLLHDGLSCLSNEDHNFNGILKFVRPIESFVYYQILSFVTDFISQVVVSASSSNPDFNISSSMKSFDIVMAFKSHISFLNMVQLSASRSLRILPYADLSTLKGQGAMNVVSCAAEDASCGSNSQNQQNANSTEYPAEMFIRNKTMAELWLQSAKYLSVIPERVIAVDFPDTDSDSWISDFFDKNICIRRPNNIGNNNNNNNLHNVKSNHAQERLLKQGFLLEYIFNSSLYDALDPSCQMPFHGVQSEKSLVSDWGLHNKIGFGNVGNISSSSPVPQINPFKFPTSNNNNNSKPSSITDLNVSECLNALHFVIELRNHIVLLSRMLLKHIPLIEIFGEIQPAHIPRYLLLWQSVHFIPNTYSTDSLLSDHPYLQNDITTDCSEPEDMIEVSLLNTGINNFEDKILPYLANNYSREVSFSLNQCLRYLAFSFLQPLEYKSSKNILETTDIFHRVLNSTFIWVRMHVNKPRECEICLNILKFVSSLLPLLEGSEIHLHMVKLCQFVTRRLYCRTLQRNLEDPLALLNYAKGDCFTMLRSYAQEKLYHEKGRTHADHGSNLVYQLVHLSSHLELIQRSILHTPALKKPYPSLLLNDNSNVGKIAPGPTTLTLKTSPPPSLKQITTNRPKILEISSTFFELDLKDCALSAAKKIMEMNLMDGVVQHHGHQLNYNNGAGNNLGGKHYENGDLVAVEVAIASSSSVNGDHEHGIFETTYFGNASRLTQSGLTPGCTYFIKARAVIGNFYCNWSPHLEVTSSRGVVFTFDAGRAGPDIAISANGLSASYSGDDCWSTVLGTHAFSSGVTSWEMRINQSSTAYVFVGVATSAADLTTFLGGCQHGWGFIGEQALYHNREKVKIYGDAYSAGDTIGVSIDLNQGTLSFSRNGKWLGVAFDKVFGELYPAVAFYNVGQEIEILPQTFVTSCPQQVIPCSPSCANLDEISILMEMSFCMQTSTPISHRLLSVIGASLNDWCSGAIKRCKMYSGKYLFLDLQSALLTRFNLIIGEKVRTPYGIAEVAGVAFENIWFRFSHVQGVWYFTQQQILSGREKGYFIRCTYYNSSSGSSTKVANKIEASNSSSDVIDMSYINSPLKRELSSEQVMTGMTFDNNTLQELFEPNRWSEAMDSVLVTFLLKYSERNNISPWNISSEQICDDFRTVQQQLTKIVMANSEMSHRWGISGPKRKAVIARIGMLRLFNHLLEQYLPVILEDGFLVANDIVGSILGGKEFKFRNNNNNKGSGSGGVRREEDDIVNNSKQQSPTSFTYGWHNNFTGKKSADELNPLILSIDYKKSTVTGAGTSVVQEMTHDSLVEVENIDSNNLKNKSWNNSSSSFVIITSWMLPSSVVLNSNLLSSSLPSIRQRVFTELKLTYFWDVLNKSTARVAKTDDDYDYPEDLPQVKINRLKSFRVREASELLSIPGEDLYLSSMFCQLWRELRQHSEDKLRISYTHPMDDGQSRAFKIKFDAEGVDDYGGPYREILQQLCDELQSPDPSLSGISNQPLKRSSSSLITGNGMDSFEENEENIKPTRCFLPFLFPTPNWTAGECAEKYKYMFHPASVSPIRLDLFKFLGQLVGIGIRSRITIDLSLPSMIWKCVVQETLTERDIASFDVSASDFIGHLHSLYKKYQSVSANACDSSQTSQEMLDVEMEAEMLLQDLFWVYTRSDGKILDLVPGGSKKMVDLKTLKSFMQAYVEARLMESKPAIDAFRAGILSVIPETALALLTWQDLELIVGGSKIIDVNRLKENTEYDDDVTAEDPHIVAFWEILAEFSEEEKASFLRFTWARPTLPPKEVEFPQKFKVQSAVGDDLSVKPDQYLPKAHTCFFSINLPRYSSKEIMAEKLRYAIVNCTEMDADFRVTDTDVVGWSSGLPVLQSNQWSSTSAEEI